MVGQQPVVGQHPSQPPGDYFMRRAFLFFNVYKCICYFRTCAVSDLCTVSVPSHRCTLYMFVDIPVVAKTGTKICRLY